MAPKVDPVTQRRRGVGLIASDPDLSAGGFTLFAPLTAGGVVQLVDLEGGVAHAWTCSTRPGRHAVLLANGNLGYNGAHPDSPDRYAAWTLWKGGLFQEVTPSGKVVWEHVDLDHHHDAQWLPNGHMLYTVAERMPAEFAARVTGGGTRHRLADGTVYGDVIREVNRAHEIVWQWKAWEHLDPADFPIHPFFDSYHWPMINGVAKTRDGLVLMSLRTTSGVVAVDRNGDVAWKIGHDIVAQQHTPVELDSGNILIFDNGNFRPGISTPYSRAVEVSPVTGKEVWDYSDPLKPSFFSPFMGGVQRLANGNTFITESSTGRLFEVTPAGEVVWEYVIPLFDEYSEPAVRAYSSGSSNSVFRAHRYAQSAIPWL